MATGTTAPGWFPLVEQDPLNAASDYFSDASLDVAWTTWDPGTTSVTITETAATRLKISQTSQAGAKHAGIFRAVPAHTRYTITADLAIFGDIGLFVSEDLSAAPTTASILLVNFALVAGGPVAAFQSWSKFDTFTAAHNATNWPVGIPKFGRIYVDTVGNTYQGLVSSNGLHWQSLGAPVAQASTQITGDPTHFGLTVSNFGGVDASGLISSMVRVDETTDPYLQIGGFLE